VQQAVRGGAGIAQQQRRTANRAHAPEAVPGAPQRSVLASLPETPAVRLERDALMAMLQQAPAIGEELLAQAVTAEVTDPTLRVVRDAIAATLPHFAEPDWVQRVCAEAPEPYHTVIRELAIASMPARNLDTIGKYARAIVVSLLERDLLSLKAELMARMQRIGDPASPDSRVIQQQLAALEHARRTLSAE